MSHTHVGGDILLSGSLDGRMRLWDTTSPGAWECAGVLEADSDGEGEIEGVGGGQVGG